MAAMTIKTGARLMGLALASLSMAAQAAEEKPLWEVGAGVAAFADLMGMDLSGAPVETAAPADALSYPTGCGDAYRSGLLYGIAAGWDWQKTGRLAAVMGAIKIAHRGGQNHRPTRKDIADHFSSAFGSRTW